MRNIYLELYFVRTGVVSDWPKGEALGMKFLLHAIKCEAVEEINGRTRRARASTWELGLFIIIQIVSSFDAFLHSVNLTLFWDGSISSANLLERAHLAFRNLSHSSDPSWFDHLLQLEHPWPASSLTFENISYRKYKKAALPLKEILVREALKQPFFCLNKTIPVNPSVVTSILFTELAWQLFSSSVKIRINSHQ